MSQELFDILDATAGRLGACEPKWLKKREEPNFEVVDYGGQGPTVLLLHGLLGAASNWEAAAPEMAKFSRTIALKFPILESHRSEVKVRSLVAYTEYFIRKEKLGPVVLCGNSMGGHVALRLCLASPDLVDCLILSGSSGLYEHSVDALPVRPGKEFVREHMKRVFFNEKFITEAAIDEIALILKNKLKQLNLIHAARSAKRDYLLKELPAIHKPTLLLWGRNDEVTTLAVGEEFQRNIPGAVLHIIDQCGHAPMIEYPQQFAGEVEEFLKKHSQFYKSHP
jgi:2-hydroxy-6-oxonona-2,4-dienedioate hydrolase